MSTEPFCFVLRNEGKESCVTWVYIPEILTRPQAAYVCEQVVALIGAERPFDNEGCTVRVFAQYVKVEWYYAALPAKLRRKPRRVQVTSLEDTIIRAIDDCFGTTRRHEARRLNNTLQVNVEQEEHGTAWTGGEALWKS